jgi:hypothetical protein
MHPVKYKTPTPSHAGEDVEQWKLSFIVNENTK